MKSATMARKSDQQGEDERVVFTKRNWTGRFLRAEVNYGDFQRIMSKIQSWDQWLPAWAEKATEYEALADAAEKQDARHSAAEAWRRAAMCWHYGKFNWFVDLDKAVNAQRHLNACYERALWSLKPPGRKVRIPFSGTEMAAIFRRPAGVPLGVLWLLAGLARGLFHFRIP